MSKNLTFEPSSLDEVAQTCFPCFPLSTAVNPGSRAWRPRAPLHGPRPCMASGFTQSRVGRTACKRTGHVCLRLRVRAHLSFLIFASNDQY